MGKKMIEFLSFITSNILTSLLISFYLYVFIDATTSKERKQWRSILEAILSRLLLLDLITFILDKVKKYRIAHLLDLIEVLRIFIGF
jgi:hypothetical protein